MGIRETLYFIISKHLLYIYIKLLLVFGVMAFDGIVIFMSLLKINNRLLLIGGGMLTGFLSLLFILGISSYIFKGHSAILTIFCLFTLFCLIIFLIKIIEFKKLLLIKFSWNLLLLLVAIIVYSTLIILYSNNAIYGGDVLTYWGIATSFARGNYPTVLPWQPNFLTAYHAGAFIVEGAVYSITRINISIVYNFFSIYFILALFLITVGIAWQKSKNLASLIPAILMVVLFSGPILPIKNFFQLNPLAFPQYSDFKQSLGSSVNNFNDLFYNNFYTFGLGTFLLFTYILAEIRSTKLIKKYILLVVILVLTLSIAENFFLLETSLIILAFFKDYRAFPFKKVVKDSSFLLLLFIILFFLIQNLIRDSFFLSPSQKPQLITLSLGHPEFFSRVNYLKSRIISSQDQSSFWYLPSLPAILLFTLFLAIWRKLYLILLLSFSSLISVLLSFLLVDKFWPESGLRFINQAFQLSFLAYGFLIPELLKQINKRVVIPILILMLVLIIPQFISNNLALIEHAYHGKGINLIRDITTKNDTLNWIYENIPFNKRVIFIDGYPFLGKHSSITEYAISFYGMYVPTGPVDIKLISYDTSGEWYDAITSLSPQALRDLNADYIYIQNQEFSRFSNKRINQLQDPQLFHFVYQNSTGTLYQITPRFKDISEEEMTLKKIAMLIPDGSTVYLDKLPVPETRKGLLIDLANRTRLMGPKFDIGDDYFLYAAAYFPFVSTMSFPPTEDFDFALTSPDTNLSPKLSKDFTQIAAIPHVVLWKKVIAH